MKSMIYHYHPRASVRFVRIPVNVTDDSGSVTGIPVNVTDGWCCAI